MSAIVVALTLGLLAIGLVAGMIVLSAFALAGLKAINAAHDSRTWFVNRRRVVR